MNRFVKLIIGLMIVSAFVLALTVTYLFFRQEQITCSLAMAILATLWMVLGIICILLLDRVHIADTKVMKRNLTDLNIKVDWILKYLESR